MKLEPASRSGVNFPGGAADRWPPVECDRAPPSPKRPTREHGPGQDVSGYYIPYFSHRLAVVPLSPAEGYRFFRAPLKDWRKLFGWTLPFEAVYEASSTRIAFDIVKIEVKPELPPGEYYLVIPCSGVDFGIADTFVEAKVTYQGTTGSSPPR